MRRTTQFITSFGFVCNLLISVAGLRGAENHGRWFDRKTTWNGYEQFHFEVAGRSAYVVAPKTVAPGTPWVWRARFPDYHAEIDIALAGKGFHIAYLDVAGMFGSAQAIAIGDKFYDEVVPPHENTYLLRKRLEQHGHPIEVISVPQGTAKSNGHHFDHPATGRVVSFVSQHAGAIESSRLDLLRRSRRIVFLGDSITYAGHYVAYFDAWLLAQKLETAPVVIDVGLPSETVSGLSEDGHAGGKFPRPDLAERLDRVLAITHPDLVFACYGINCGIYQPFDEERFSRYQYGVRTLKQKVEAAGATLVLITPPAYDDQRARKPFSYNAVLDRYAEWLLSQRKQGWLVVNLHGPMTAEVAERRITNPEFTFQPDAVHPNSAGHWFMASQLIRWFGDEQAANADSPDKTLTADVMMLIRQRIRVRRDAYLGEAGHKRPGINSGLPVLEAEEKAEDISMQLRELLDKTP